MLTGTVRVGVSGWSYQSWRGDFYPADLPKVAELDYAANIFDTIEINRTFYSLGRPSAFRAWGRAGPPSLRYAVKGSRFITHTKRIGDVDTALANFAASGILALGPKLGPILWQLPASLRFDPDRVDRFLELLPSDAKGLRRLARRHDGRVDEAEIGDEATNRRVRHVLEPRHPSAFVPDLVRIVRRHGVALAFSHSSKWPYTEELTAGFVYLRLHGPEKLYASAYSAADMDRWEHRIRFWAEGDEPSDAERITDGRPPSRERRDVYVYFDNDTGGHAPHQAQDLRRRLDEG